MRQPVSLQSGKKYLPATTTQYPPSTADFRSLSYYKSVPGCSVSFRHLPLSFLPFTSIIPATDLRVVRHLVSCTDPGEPEDPVIHQRTIFNTQCSTFNALPTHYRTHQLKSPAPGSGAFLPDRVHIQSSASLHR